MSKAPSIASSKRSKGSYRAVGKASNVDEALFGPPSRDQQKPSARVTVNLNELKAKLVTGQQVKESAAVIPL
jgi:hypothetical protein